MQKYFLWKKIFAKKKGSAREASIKQRASEASAVRFETNNKIIYFISPSLVSPLWGDIGGMAARKIIALPSLPYPSQYPPLKGRARSDRPARGKINN